MFLCFSSFSISSSDSASRWRSLLLDEEPEIVRCRLASALPLVKGFGQSRYSTKDEVRQRTHSSLSLRLRFPLRWPVPVLARASFLLSSRALRNSASSSYFASRLFIVGRRPFANVSALARADLLSLCFLEFSLALWLNGSGDADSDFESWAGRKREYFRLRGIE